MQVTLKPEENGEPCKEDPSPSADGESDYAATAVCTCDPAEA